MRKVLLLALVSMFFATACNKTEETAPAPPEAAASAAAPAEGPAPRRPAPSETGAGGWRTEYLAHRSTCARLVRSIAWRLIRCGDRCGHPD